MLLGAAAGIGAAALGSVWAMRCAEGWEADGHGAVAAFGIEPADGARWRRQGAAMAAALGLAGALWSPFTAAGAAALGWVGALDLRYRLIDPAMICAVAACGCLGAPGGPAAALAVGGACLLGLYALSSVAGKGRFGLGDAAVVAAMPCLLGPAPMMRFLLVSAVELALALAWLKRRDEDTTVPLAPLTLVPVAATFVWSLM